jgi:membrane protein implicated in regulation of membrane protease activity
LLAVAVFLVFWVVIIPAIGVLGHALGGAWGAFFAIVAFLVMLIGGVMLWEAYQDSRRPSSGGGDGYGGYSHSHDHDHH